jgi:hypothetical protein
MRLPEYSRDQIRAGNAETILGAPHDVNKCKRCVGERDRYTCKRMDIVSFDDSYGAMFFSPWPPYGTNEFSSVLALA